MEVIRDIFQHAKPFGHNEKPENFNLGFGFLYYGVVRAVRPNHVLVIGSGFGFTQSYQFPSWSQTGLWYQPWDTYGLTGFQTYMPQSTTPYGYTIGVPGQYPIGGYTMGRWPYSSLGLGMTSYTRPIGFPGTGLPTIPYAPPKLAEPFIKVEAKGVDGNYKRF